MLLGEAFFFSSAWLWLTLESTDDPKEECTVCMLEHLSHTSVKIAELSRKHS